MRRQTVGPFLSSQFSPLVFIPLWTHLARKHEILLNKATYQYFTLLMIDVHFLAESRYQLTLYVNIKNSHFQVTTANGMVM